MVRILLSAWPFPHGEPTLVGKNFVPVVVGIHRIRWMSIIRVHCQISGIWEYWRVWWSFFRLLRSVFLSVGLALGRFGCNRWRGRLPIERLCCLFLLEACLAWGRLHMSFLGSRCSLFCGGVDLFLLLRWTGKLGSCSLGFWVFLSACFAAHGSIVECLLLCVIWRNVDRTLWNVLRWWRCQVVMMVALAWGWTDSWSIGLFELLGCECSR